jgi:hypothetical protein
LLKNDARGRQADTKLFAATLFGLLSRNRDWIGMNRSKKHEVLFVAHLRSLQPIPPNAVTSQSRRGIYVASIAMAILVMLLLFHWRDRIWSFWVWLGN